MTLSPDLRVNLDRFWSTIEASAQIGQGRPGGLARLTLTDADAEMRALFSGWCREAGLSVSTDAMGSIHARRDGTDNSLPPIMIGSHLDTQVNGGRFDGIAGVLAGLEVIRTLNDAGHVTRRPIVVVNWTNEEGARFSPPMVASGAFIGRYDLDWCYALTAEDGARFGDELERIDAIEALGIAPSAASPVYWRTLANRLAARLPLPEYTAERHAAWLTGRALP